MLTLLSADPTHLSSRRPTRADEPAMGFLSRLFGSVDRPPAVPQDDSMSRVPIETLEQVQQLALNKRKIDAIKLYREASRCGLKEAKEAVEQIVREAA